MTGDSQGEGIREPLRRSPRAESQIVSYTTAKRHSAECRTQNTENQTAISKNLTLATTENGTAYGTSSNGNGSILQPDLDRDMSRSPRAQPAVAHGSTEEFY